MMDGQTGRKKRMQLYKWQRNWQRWSLVALAIGLGPLGWAQVPMQKEAYPTIKVRELPDVLRAQWNQTKPQMNSNSRCAAAFDSHSDYDRMTLKCSVYIKLGAVGARRAMGYCEEEREKLHIHAPCKIVLEE